MANNIEQIANNKWIIKDESGNTLYTTETTMQGNNTVYTNEYPTGEIRQTIESTDALGRNVSNTRYYEGRTGRDINTVTNSYDDSGNIVTTTKYTGIDADATRTKIVKTDNLGNRVEENYYPPKGDQPAKLITTTYEGDSDTVISTSSTMENSDGSKITVYQEADRTVATINGNTPNGRGTSNITSVSSDGKTTIESVSTYKDHSLTIKEVQNENGVTSQRVRTYSDADGNPLKSTTTSYDENSYKVTSTTIAKRNADGSATITVVEGNKQTTNVLDANNNPIEKVVVTTNSNGSVETVKTTYDKDGVAKVERTLEDGITTKNEGRNTTIVTTEGNKQTKTVIDKNGAIVSETEITGGAQGSREVKTNYDAEGNVISSEVTTFKSNGTNVTVYGVDENGNEVVNYSLLKDDKGNTTYYDKEGKEIDLNSISDNPDSALAQYASNHISTSAGRTITSNLSYVQNSMDSLQSRISGVDALSYTGGTGSLGSSEAPVVGSVYDATNYYTNITNNLYGKLGAEISTVKAIAQAMYDMDQSANKAAENGLTDGSDINIFSSSNYGTQLAALNANMHDVAITSAQESSRAFNKIADTLQSTVTNGNVGFVSKDSLLNAVNSITPILQGEIDRANSMQADINSFIDGISSSGVLQGDVWENVKTNMEQYNNLLECNKEAANFLTDTVTKAMGMVVELMDQEGLTEIDDKNYQEYCDNLEKAKRDIARLTTLIANMRASQHWVDEYDSIGKWIGSHKDPSDEEIGAKEAELAEAEALKDECEHWKGVYEELARRVQAAQDAILEATEKIRATYANPTEILQGNVDFPSTFSLDLSAYAGYGIDPNVDYKKSIYPDENSPLEETAKVETEAGKKDDKVKEGTVEGEDKATEKPAIEPYSKTETLEDGTIRTEAVDKDGNKIVRDVATDGTINQTETYADGSTRTIATDKDGNKVIRDVAADGTINQRETYADGSTRTIATNQQGDKVVRDVAVDGTITQREEKANGIVKTITNHPKAEEKPTATVEEETKTEGPDANLEETTNTRNTAGTTNTGNRNGGGNYGGGGNPSGGYNQNPSTSNTSTPSRTTNNTKQEDDELEKMRKEAEAQRKAIEEAARNNNTQTSSSKVDTSGKSAAEEAARNSIPKQTETKTSATTMNNNTYNNSSDGVEKLTTKHSGGGVNSNPSYTNINPGEEDEIIEELVFDEPTIIEDTPAVENYSEVAPVEPVIEEEPVTIEPIVEEPKDNKVIKTLGIAAGAGLAVGASALGAHTLVKDKDEEEEEEKDYGYDK